MRRNGFTLLEVLIALLVFSLGLLGMAGLLAVSVRTNQGAYLRSQAVFLAQSMADRMRANNIGMWKLAYNGTYDKSTKGSTGTACLNTASCTWSQVKDRDTMIWSNQLVSFLPNPSATINCATTGSAPGADTMVEKPPYNGQCSISISWNERALQTGQADQSTTLTWVFQP